MRVLTALVFPWFTLLSIGRTRDARICMALQLTVIGWPAAAWWALRALLRAAPVMPAGVVRHGSPQGSHERDAENQHK